MWRWPFNELYGNGMKECGHTASWVILREKCWGTSFSTPVRKHPRLAIKIDINESALSKTTIQILFLNIYQTKRFAMMLMFTRTLSDSSDGKTVATSVNRPYKCLHTHWAIETLFTTITSHFSMPWFKPYIENRVTFLTCKGFCAVANCNCFPNCY